MSTQLSINLRSRLQKAGVTQLAAAKALGVNPATVNRWCKLHTVPHYRAAELRDFLASKQGTKVITKRQGETIKVAVIGKKPQGTKEPVMSVTTKRHARNRKAGNSKTNAFTTGYEQALQTIRYLLSVPTNQDTKLQLISSFSSIATDSVIS